MVHFVFLRERAYLMRGRENSSVALLGCLLLFATNAGAEDWTVMFNGKSIEGWTQKNGTATYRVEDGAIVGKTAEGSPNSFLCSVKEYADFELEFEAKVHSNLNSGVQIRSQTRDEDGVNTIYNTGRVNGPQVEIEASGASGALAGYVYGEATGRGWLTAEERLRPHKHLQDGQWNQFRVIAQGPRIRTFINGQPIEDLNDEEIYKTHPRGFIGLQVHGIGRQAGPYEVSWRNIRIREL